IDRSQSRGNTPWNPLVANTAIMSGARAVNPILAAVMCDRDNRPDIWPQSLRSELIHSLASRGPSTYGRNRFDQNSFILLQAGGRPHMDSGLAPRGAARNDDREFGPQLRIPAA